MTPAAAGPQPEAAAIRQALAAADAALDARFDAPGFDALRDMDALTRTRSDTVDAHVLAAWHACTAGTDGLALFAVGGYGRRELFPQSDLDLLVLAEVDAQARHADAIAAFIRLLWDAGLPVGQAVRSPAQCTEAAADITVLTAMLDARALAASPPDSERLQAAVAPAQAWPAAAFFEAKRAELRARHARHGDTADNLEPNLKDGPGGLRDLQTLRWMALRVLGTGELDALVALGQLGVDEADTLRRQRINLSQLRWGLHGVARKREERLRFDLQKKLATRLTQVEEADTAAVERMMQAFYRSAALVLRLGERLLQRFEEQIEGEPAPVPVGDGFELRRGYLAAAGVQAGWPGGPADVLDLFATWATLDAGDEAPVRGLHSRTARALAEALPVIDDIEHAPAPLRARFRHLLRGPQAVATLTRMARLGVLARLIPAFAGVSGRMQFDLFHVYTVDQHTLAVLANVAAFADGTDTRFALAADVWPRLRKPEVLLLAALFHDIGKGRGGDHAELGADDARVFCTALGLPEADAALVEWLVRRHLLMSVTAQKQDIADPEVIHRFAGEVADRERLDHLYLLTCADIAGTSPKLWNAWKDRLLADLYTATRLALRRGLEHPVAAADRIDEVRAGVRASLAGFGMDAPAIDAVLARIPDVAFLRGRPGQVAWQAASLRGAAAGETRVRVRQPGGAGALEVFVHTPDRDGLFAALVATLDRLGLAIQQARVLDAPALPGQPAMAFDTFEVLAVDARQLPAPQEVEARIATVLAAPLAGVRPARRAQPTHLRHFRIAPQVVFDDAPAGRTRLSLVGTDRPGLLADVAQVLRDAGLRVHDARIATFGERAEDVFLLTSADAHGRDVPLDASRQQALATTLSACLQGDCP